MRAYGGGAADFAYTVEAVSKRLRAASGQVVTFYDAETGGAAVTDLRAADAVTVISSVTARADGTLPRFFDAEDHDELWADVGLTHRVRMVPVAGGFDATATPIIIGEDASISGDFDPASNPVTVIGYAAYSEAALSVVVGGNAYAGPDAISAVVVGSGAEAEGNAATAVGPGTSAAGGASVALGYAAEAADTNEVALGGPSTFLTCAGADGIVVRSPDGTRWRITVTDAGTITVAAA